MSQRPHILISNDDGIQAPGILALVEVAKEFGDVTVVAPDSAQSGMGHAISIAKPLRVYKEILPDGTLGYALSGTPADCVKFATGVMMKEPADLVLSGINHGANSSVSSIYSGTLSAAREGAMQGLPSIGFSLCHFLHDGDMSAAKAIARKVIAESLKKELQGGYLLNVNIPYLPLEEIKGIRITRQAKGRWIEEFDERVDPFGRKYYWLTGNFALMDEGEDTDEHAIRNGYVSVTPMIHDLTDYPHREEMAQTWQF
ncbi:MAG: 5'/3'-nucleotidase SurE [Bacteroidota bacterium]